MLQALGSFHLLVFVAVFTFLGFWPQAHAAKIASYCYAEANDPEFKIEGLKPDLRLPIASVSKLFTTDWALSVMSPEDRFVTQIFISPVTKDKNGTKIVDIHLVGSRDPYFGKETLHYLASELNKMGIYYIRTLSFDENFKFFWNVGGGNMVSKRGQKVETGYYGADDPKPDDVRKELSIACVRTKNGKHCLKTTYKHDLTYRYNLSRNALKALNIELLPKAHLHAAEIKFVHSAKFTPSKSMTRRVVWSSPLIMLLKEMNRNSNNHSANQIFERLGGSERFTTFMQTLNFTEDDVLFYNGHGNRHDLPDKSVYNEASCSTVLKIIARLRKKLLSIGKDLDDVLPVPGVDVKSTLVNYDTKAYGDALAAKTGTVGPAVTLAGMLLTQKGPVFFMYNMRTYESVADWRRARRGIANRLMQLTKKFDGGKPFDARQVKFIAFDSEMFFQKEDWQGDDSELAEESDDSAEIETVADSKN